MAATLVTSLIVGLVVIVVGLLVNGAHVFELSGRSRAHVPMLPSVASQDHARWQILTYTLLVVIASLLLFSVHALGDIYLAAAILLGGGFIVQAIQLSRGGTAHQARRTFLHSNLYLAALFGATILDRLV